MVWKLYFFFYVIYAVYRLFSMLFPIYAVSIFPPLENNLFTVHYYGLIGMLIFSFAFNKQFISHKSWIIVLVIYIVAFILGLVEEVYYPPTSPLFNHVRFFEDLEYIVLLPFDIILYKMVFRFKYSMKN